MGDDEDAAFVVVVFVEVVVENQGRKVNSPIASTSVHDLFSPADSPYLCPLRKAEPQPKLPFSPANGRIPGHNEFWLDLEPSLVYLVALCGPARCLSAWMIPSYQTGQRAVGTALRCL